MSPSSAGPPVSTRLGNGLEVHLLRRDDAPVVTTALTYRAGALDDPVGRSGVAHFLEHMMFKGSPRFGSGEIDRRTRELGGSNNAFTTHDTTTYYFSFGAERWEEALDLEADRLLGLRLEGGEIESERSVILEELAMYESEPWDALERAVQSSLFGKHPYGRPIIGLSDEVRSISAEDLATFHRLHYRPDNAVLAVAGEIGDSAHQLIADRFAGIESSAAPDTQASVPVHPAQCDRVEVARGQVPRLLFAFPAPRADHADFAALRLLCSLLTSGRSSRLCDRLVERDGLCSWISAGIGETRYGGALQIAAELTLGSQPAEVESLVLEELSRLRQSYLDEGAVRRARRVFEADWVFGHERVEAQALTLAQAAALVGPRYATEQLAAIGALGAGELQRAAQRYFDPSQGSVLGWARAEGS